MTLPSRRILAGAETVAVTVAVTVRVLRGHKLTSVLVVIQSNLLTYDGSGVIVVQKYDEQSAVPGLVGKLEALTAERS